MTGSTVRTYGRRVANPYLARQLEYRQALEASLEQGCMFCAQGAAFRQKEPLFQRGNTVVHQNDFPARDSVYLNGNDWDRDYLAGSFKKHMVVFNRQAHYEGLEQLSPEEFKEWWEAIALGVETRKAEGIDECTFVYIKEGDADRNSATVNHLHAQAISLDLQTVTDRRVPLVGCCLDGALLSPIATVLNAGDLSVQTEQVHCLSLRRMGEVQYLSNIGGWRAAQALDCGGALMGRWLFQQNRTTAPVSNYMDFASWNRNLRDFRELLLSVTSSVPGGVLVLYPHRYTPRSPLSAQYFQLRDDVAAVVTS